MNVDLVIVREILRGLAIIVLYFFVGFGPGFVLGVLTANNILARGKPTTMDNYAEAKKLAAQHNAQWHPDNDRWQ